MCKIIENLILCSCENEPPQPTIHHKKSKRWKEKHPELYQPLYVWVLSKYGGAKKYNSQFFEGAAIMDIFCLYYPSEMLSKDITAELFVKELNKRNCFDFDYELQDGDSLEILKDGSHANFFSFIFKNNNWEIDWYFHTENIILTKIDCGKVKF